MRKRSISSLKGFVILNALLLLLAFSASNAFADFYVIAGSRGVGTQIKSLPYTISSPGFYYIAKDLSCAAGIHGITITADNVTLDLMGFSLVGPGVGTGNYAGIYMNARTNVEIRNGTVRNFSMRGIYECNGDAGTSHRIINIRAGNNGNCGIILVGKNNLVERCTAVWNGDYGIHTGPGSTVTGNTCYSNGTNGIATDHGSTVTGNTCYNNTSNGIYTKIGSTVTGNTCYSNTLDGINADDGSTITGNTCYNNTSDGMEVGQGSTITGNTCYNNTGYGIYFGLNGNCIVDQNTALLNTAGNTDTCATCTFGTNHMP